MLSITLSGQCNEGRDRRSQACTAIGPARSRSSRHFGKTSLRLSPETCPEEYKLWLCEAQQKGMKELLKASRNHEEIAQRPHQQASLDLRPFLRLSHWLKIWKGRADGPQLAEHPRRDELRQKAKQQALGIPQINSAAWKEAAKRGAQTSGHMRSSITSLLKRLRKSGSPA